MKGVQLVFSRVTFVAFSARESTCGASGAMCFCDGKYKREGTCVPRAFANKRKPGLLRPVTSSLSRACVAEL